MSDENNTGQDASIDIGEPMTDVTPTSNDVQPPAPPIEVKARPTQKLDGTNTYGTTNNLHAEYDSRIKAMGLDEKEELQLRIEDIIGLPSVPQDIAIEGVSRTPNMEIPANKESMLWQRRASEAYNTVSDGDMYLGSLIREGSNWTNKLSHNNKPLFSTHPKLPATSRQLGGEEGVLRMAYHLGTGALNNVLLPHSGIYITFKPPSEDQILEVNRLIISEKIKLGRETYGLAFTNYTVYTMRTLVEFALSNIYNSTLNINNDNKDSKDSKDIKDYILIQDYPILLNGFAATMYPKGIMYESPCMTDPTVCTHVSKEVIAMNKMQHDDSTRFSESHLAHLLDRRANSRSTSEVKQYQNTLLPVANKEVRLVSTEGQEVFVTLKSPSINDSISHGTEWIDSIVNIVESKAGADIPVENKEAHFRHHARASEMNHYRHFVKSVRFGEFSEIESAEDVHKQLTAMSQNDGLRSSFLEEVKKYINDSTLSIIGIPTFSCPACGGVQPTGTTTDNKELKEIIPLDAQQLFFDLITRKLLKIVRR